MKTSSANFASFVAKMSLGEAGEQRPPLYSLKLGFSGPDHFVRNMLADLKSDLCAISPRPDFGIGASKPPYPK